MTLKVGNIERILFHVDLYFARIPMSAFKVAIHIRLID